MICVNELTEQKCNSREIISDFTVLLSSYAPHISEEIWNKLGNTTSVTIAEFPKFNDSCLVEDEVNYPVSFNGKMSNKMTRVVVTGMGVMSPLGGTYYDC